jgi:hypothetical protein
VILAISGAGKLKVAIVDVIKYRVNGIIVKAKGTEEAAFHFD